jgi:MFS family permease
MEAPEDSSDPYASLRIKDFRRFVIAYFLLTFALQMQSVVIGWQVYQLTHDALSLGLIGFVEIVPFLSILLFTGHVADVFSRKRIIVISSVVYVVCGTALLILSTALRPVLAAHGAIPIYCVVFVMGLARGFMSPAILALAVQLVPRELYANASTWNSVAWQIGEVAGPAVGGLVYGFSGAGSAYAVVAVMSVIVFFVYTTVSDRPLPKRDTILSMKESLAEGLRFVFGHEVILSAISLDLFAVLFGGAVAVLPIFADSVLHAGPEGLGILRAAPAVGAITMSIIQAHRPFLDRAGRSLVVSVFGFGASIVVFALSRNIYLSLFALFLNGLFDNVSVVVRSAIVQLHTPDELRGRVSAVNGIFTGASDGLGSFESGFAARLIGLVPSVVLGGGVTLAVATAVKSISPKLWKLRM